MGNDIVGRVMEHQGVMERQRIFEIRRVFAVEFSVYDDETLRDAVTRFDESPKTFVRWFVNECVDAACKLSMYRDSRNVTWLALPQYVEIRDYRYRWHGVEQTGEMRRVVDEHANWLVDHELLVVATWCFLDTFGRLVHGAPVDVAKRALCIAHELYDDLFASVVLQFVRCPELWSYDAQIKTVDMLWNGDDAEVPVYVEEA